MWYTASSWKACKPTPRTGLLELANVLVRFDHISRIIVNANHRIVRVLDEDLHKN
jgi:hypothetical protein